MRTDKVYATLKKRQGGGAGMKIHSKEKKKLDRSKDKQKTCVRAFPKIW